MNVGRTANGPSVAEVGSHGIDNGQHGLVATGVGRGDSQSPSDHNLFMDSTEGMDFSHFFISAAVRFVDKKANRLAHSVAAHVLKFLAVKPMPLESRMYWLMCSALRSTSLPASEMYMKRSASFAPRRLVLRIKSTSSSSSMVMCQSLPDLPVNENTRRADLQHRRL